MGGEELVIDNGKCSYCQKNDAFIQIEFLDVEELLWSCTDKVCLRLAFNDIEDDVDELSDEDAP
jgi:hypothetical protein